MESMFCQGVYLTKHTFLNLAYKFAIYPYFLAFLHLSSHNCFYTINSNLATFYKLISFSS